MSRHITDTICSTVLYFTKPARKAITMPSSDCNHSPGPVTRISRPMMTATIHEGTRSSGMSMINATATSSLSASGVKKFPQRCFKIPAPGNIGHPENRSAICKGQKASDASRAERPWLGNRKNRIKNSGCHKKCETA